MASVSTDKRTGLRRILVVLPNGQRPQIRLGSVSAKAARSICGHVEELVRAKRTRTDIDRRTMDWLADIDDDLHGRLADFELVQPRVQREPEVMPEAVVTLGQLLDDYISARSDIKQRTKWMLQQTKGQLIGFFGADKPLADINEADAEDFRRWMKAEGYAENTVRRHCGRAKQFLRRAVQKKLISSNPFAELKRLSVQGNPDRLRYVTDEEAQRLIDASPDVDWRTIIALCRWGGLRCPSEVLSLEWSHIHWDRQRMTIPQPKLEHIDGKQTREAPLFGKLAPYLDAAFEAAKLGARFVISRYRDAQNANLRQQLGRIAERAGLSLWPKPFQNMRASLEDDLARDFPIHEVTAWVGNSPKVALKHYLIVRDDSFRRASEKQTPDPRTESGAVCAQNPAQHTSVRVRNASHESSQHLTDPRDMQTVAKQCDSVQKYRIAEAGIEPARAVKPRGF